MSTINRLRPLKTVDRSYKSALDILHTRRRLKRPSTGPESNAPNGTDVSSSKAKTELKGTPSILGMRQWLSQIGHSTSDIDKLNIIHVAGTKGKGSTCAFVESFLRAFGTRAGFPKKTGLYTSPHLIDPEERIRINFQPIAREAFAKYFFEVWDAIIQNATHEDAENQALPRYLQLMALVSFHAFVREGVDAAVFETHNGGEYDATNVVEHPVATIVTSLGMDHVEQLGPTLEDIAWHKAGIFKPGAHAISAPQEAPAADVLRKRASEKGTAVEFVEDDGSLPANTLQLTPDIQRTNGSVALAAVRRFLQEKAPKDGPSLSLADISKGVSQFSWPGRFQLVLEGPNKWFLDGAHNEMSVTKAAEWFMAGSLGFKAPAAQILIFSQVGNQRDSTVVLERLAAALSSIHIDHVIFTLYSSYQRFDSAEAVASSSEVAPPKTEFGETWKKYHPNSNILYEPNIRQALDTARSIGKEAGDLHTLITGSQHLVGGALYSLNNPVAAQTST